MRRDIVIGALALAALFGVSFFHREEPPPGQTRASGDFSAGGYRGWYELLAREGVSVERFRQHHDALRDGGIDTLIVAFPSSGPGGGTPVLWNAAERDALRAWVRSGGHFVDVGATPSVDKNDGNGELVFGDEPAKGAPGALRGPWSPLVGAWQHRGDVRLVAAKGAHVRTLLADHGGALVMSYRYGRGSVVSVADAAVFQNDALGHGDDARLAYLVARPSAPHGVVAFDEAVRNDIVERAWYRALDAPELIALAILALAGLLWLLYGIVPLGPAVRLNPPREPTSAEFLDAVAALYGRAQARDHARDELVADARRSLERAPLVPENADLARRVDALAAVHVADDAALVAVAQLARTARENTMTSTPVPRRTARRAVSPHRSGVA